MLNAVDPSGEFKDATIIGLENQLHMEPYLIQKDSEAVSP
jgi:hypothetical protein